MSDQATGSENTKTETKTGDATKAAGNGGDLPSMGLGAETKTDQKTETKTETGTENSKVALEVPDGYSHIKTDGFKSQAELDAVLAHVQSDRANSETIRNDQIRSWAKELEGRPTYKADVELLNKHLLATSGPKFIKHLNDTRATYNPVIFDELLAMAKRASPPGIQSSGSPAAKEMTREQRAQAEYQTMFKA